MREAVRCATRDLHLRSEISLALCGTTHKHDDRFTSLFWFTCAKFSLQRVTNRIASMLLCALNVLIFLFACKTSSKPLYILYVEFIRTFKVLMFFLIVWINVYMILVPNIDLDIESDCAKILSSSVNRNLNNPKKNKLNIFTVNKSKWLFYSLDLNCDFQAYQNERSSENLLHCCAYWMSVS